MLKFDDKSLIPAIVQDARTGEVLMLGYMNKESLKRTLASGPLANVLQPQPAAIVAQRRNLGQLPQIEVHHQGLRRRYSSHKC
jgi:hypothetical protein